jgi:CBS domain-containing protein
MICPACKHENIEGAELCEHCGVDLTHLSRPKASSPAEKLLHKRPISDLRPHAPVVVPSSRKVRDVIASMVIRHDGCAVVVNEAGEVIGIFTERDLLMKLAGKPDELLDSPVGEFMTPDPVTTTADVPIAYVLHQMDIGGYRHIPIVDGKKPVGMVSIRDIITFFGVG